MGELEEDCGFHKLQCLPDCFSKSILLQPFDLMLGKYILLGSKKL